MLSVSVYFLQVWLWYIYSMFIVCLWYIYPMFIVCLWYIYPMFIVCLWYVVGKERVGSKEQGIGRRDTFLLHLTLRDFVLVIQLR